MNLLNRLDYDKYNVTCLVIRGSLEMADRITSKCRLIVADREKTISFPKAYKYSRLYHLTEESENPSRLHKAMMWAVPAIKWVENRLYMKNNPYPYIKRADLYVQPSRFEGYPMTILEALILSQPVVSTNNAGAKEILQDGATCVLCKISARSVADKVHELLNNAEALENLRRNVAELDMDAGNKTILNQLEKIV